jgi:hypothetical protein
LHGAVGKPGFQQHLNLNWRQVGLRQRGNLGCAKLVDRRRGGSELVGEAQRILQMPAGVLLERRPRSFQCIGDAVADEAAQACALRASEGAPAERTKMESVSLIRPAAALRRVGPEQADASWASSSAKGEVSYRALLDY